MAAQQLIDILQHEENTSKLITVIKKQDVLDQFIDVSNKEIKILFTELGLKAAEFKTICKYYKNEELLFNELASLEQIVELLPKDE